MKSGYREQTCSLCGPNRRGTGPDITDCTLWHGSTGRLNWSYSTYFWGLFSTGDCKSLAIICRVAAVRFDSFSPHHLTWRCRMSWILVFWLQFPENSATHDRYVSEAKCLESARAWDARLRAVRSKMNVECRLEK